MNGIDWPSIERAVVGYAAGVPAVEEVTRRLQVLARLQRLCRHLRRAAVERDEVRRLAREAEHERPG